MRRVVNVIILYYLLFFSDLIETATNYNHRIDFDEDDFNEIVKNFYFLLK